MGTVDHTSQVCIVGLGPAGIGAALTFFDSSLSTRVLCLDAGNHPGIRSCSILQGGSCTKEEPCQMISGFGGCSLLGGGKISTFPAGSRLASVLGSKELTKRRLSEALSLISNYLSLQKPDVTANDIKDAKALFAKLGFEYRYYDAYLFDQEELRRAYQEVFSQLNSAGMSLLLNTKLIRIDPKEDGFKLVAKQGEERITIFTKYLVLGVGRLGRSFLKSLNAKSGLNGKENQLDIGVRLEFPTDLYPEVTRYHNDLKLLFEDARTFCVSKNGRIAPYFLEDVFFTEGHFNSRLESGFTNIGIMIRLRPSKQNEVILNEVKKRTLYISNKPVSQGLLGYLSIDTKDHSYESPRAFQSSISFRVQGNVNQCFPYFISARIKEAVSYFSSRLLPKDRWGEVNVFAPEVDYGGLSFPINSDFSTIPRMYLIGDCTGRFRGILQALCSGMVCAESIIGAENE